MPDMEPKEWKSKLVAPGKVLSKIKPGMKIFLGTGVAEPCTLVKSLLDSDAGNLRDLEFIQLMSFGPAISITRNQNHKYRLKTFFAGWVASEEITSGRVDMVPSPI